MSGILSVEETVYFDSSTMWVRERTLLDLRTDRREPGANGMHALMNKLRTRQRTGYRPYLLRVAMADIGGRKGLATISHTYPGYSARASTRVMQTEHLSTHRDLSQPRGSFEI